MVARTITAVLLGVLWVFYTVFAGGIFLDEPRLWALIAVPGFYLLCIALVFALPWISELLPGLWGSALAFAIVTGVHAATVSTLGAAAPWFKVIAVSGVYVLFAIAALRAMGGFHD